MPYPALKDSNLQGHDDAQHYYLLVDNAAELSNRKGIILSASDTVTVPYSS